MSSLPIRGADDNRMDSLTDANASTMATQHLPASDESATSKTKISIEHGQAHDADVDKTALSMTPSANADASTTAANDAPDTAPSTATPTPAEDEEPAKKPTTFESLPAQLRNHIYHLSANLTIHQCKICTKTAPANSPLEWIRSAPAKPPFEWIRSGTDWATVLRHSRDSCRQDMGKHFSNQLPGTTDARIFVAGRVEPSIMTIPYDRELKLDEKEQVFYYSHPQPSALIQPPVTRVSRLVRSDTLPMFYGDRQFYFTMFSSDSTRDGEAVLKWLKTIGPSNAALLRNVAVVYARRQTGYYIKRNLLAKIGELGVDVGEFGGSEEKGEIGEEILTPGAGVHVAEPASTTPSSKHDISTGDVPTPGAADDKSAADAPSDAVSTTAKTTEPEKKKNKVIPLQGKSTGIVRLVRIPHPFCQCGACVLQALWRNDKEGKEARKAASKARKEERRRARAAGQLPNVENGA